MFLDNLSTSVLKLCDTRRLSYEAASERCDLSSRYFADIARGKTAPTILTLEKLCVGFDLTPNDLLIPSELWREMAFREPMPVTHIRCFHFFHGLTGFPVCPQCGRTLEREYQPYCDRCGQCLDWKRFLQSNDYPASEIILTATYLLIRPASFTCWLLLACPFPLLSIFLHFPIDFLFADFTSVPAWANSLMASWMA